MMRGRVVEELKTFSFNETDDYFNAPRGFVSSARKLAW
jgi:hypothetical protein